MDPFWGPILQGFLGKIAPQVVQAVGDVFRALWDKRAKTPPLPASASPFDVPPPLPLALTPLVGREADFAGVLGALSSNRLVTLTGLGGVGKTALAQTLARWAWEEDRAKSKTPRGVPYVTLDALASGRELADFVRRQLLPDSPPPATADENARQSDAVRVIADTLNAGARLLVLDNFESAMDSAGAPLALYFVRNLVAATSDAVRVLVTSRRALNLAPIETEYPLEPLEEKHAIELFYARAGESVSANDRPTITEVCRLEDCLPLGIELAAAAVQQKTRPLKEMLSALRVTPLDVEIADALGYPERQRGLAATLRYTYDHLPSDAARRLFCAFSVFHGGADRDAVKYVDGTDTWEKATRDLVAWKLLNVDEARDPWWYTMLGTTAAFSALQMQKLGATLGLDANALLRRHTEYFVRMENWREIEVNWQNIKAGADRAVCELEVRNSAMHDRAGLAEIYTSIGLNRARHRDYATALECYEKSVELYEALNDKAGLATTYNYIGLVHDAREDYVVALECYEKSIALKEKLGDKQGLATTYNNIATIHYSCGEYAAALEWYEKSVALKEALGNKAGLATTFNTIGAIYFAQKDLPKALEWVRKSAEMFQQLGALNEFATLQWNLAGLALAMGDRARAKQYAQESLRLHEQLKLEKIAARVRAWMRENGLL